MRSTFVKTPKQSHQTLLNPFGDARSEQGEKVKGEEVYSGMFRLVLTLFP